MRLPILSFPFRIGRRTLRALGLSAHGVSSEHAELFFDGEFVRVRDLNSTNGTFLNRKRIRVESRVEEGDILHFATAEFEFISEEEDDTTGVTIVTRVEADALPQYSLANTPEFRRMLEGDTLDVLYQPIVALADGHPTMGYEALARGTAEGMPINPNEIFPLAASISAERELSRTLRLKAALGAWRLPGAPRIFINTQPSEASTPELIDSMREIRESCPHLGIVLEIHEGAVTDFRYMRMLRDELDELDIALAYDDFGSGQARLNELVDAPPRYLKFDRSLVDGLHRASPHKKLLVRTLVRMVIDFGIEPIAEGIEQPPDAELCTDFGFRYAQGYYYGRPKSADAYLLPRRVHRGI